MQKNVIIMMIELPQYLGQYYKYIYNKMAKAKVLPETMARARRPRNETS